MSDQQTEQQPNPEKPFVHTNEERIARRKLLTPFTKVVNILDLFGGVLCNTGAASFLFNTVKDTDVDNHTYIEAIVIAIFIEVAAVLFFLMNLLLLLGHKSAVRLAKISLFIFIPIVIFFSFIAIFFNFMLGFMLITLLLVLAAHVPYYLNLFKIRKSWETAVSHDSSLS